MNRLDRMILAKQLVSLAHDLTQPPPAGQPPEAQKPGLQAPSTSPAKPAVSPPQPGQPPKPGQEQAKSATQQEWDDDEEFIKKSHARDNQAHVYLADLAQNKTLFLGLKNLLRDVCKEQGGYYFSAYAKDLASVLDKLSEEETDDDFGSAGDTYRRLSNIGK